MRKVYPYRTLAGAMKALDNGGRFYQLFTKAGDDVVTAAELKKAAGVFSDDKVAGLFFALAVSQLTDEEQQQVRAALGSEARALLRWHEPQPIEWDEFATVARAGKGFVVEGTPRHVDETVDAGIIFVPIMVGNITTLMPIPLQQRYDVYEIGEGPEPCRVMVTKQAMILRGRYRFAGVAKTIELQKGGKKTSLLRLEPRFYCEA